MRENVAERRGIDENRRGNAGRFEESHRRKNLSHMSPKATAMQQHVALRRAAVGRCTPIGSRSLHSVRRQIENLSIGNTKGNVRGLE
jgi:hypothetical protein